MITQSFEIIKKSVFGRTLEPHMGMKGWFAKGEPARDLLSDLRARLFIITAIILSLPCSVQKVQNDECYKLSIIVVYFN